MCGDVLCPTGMRCHVHKQDGQPDRGVCMCRSKCPESVRHNLHVKTQTDHYQLYLKYNAQLWPLHDWGGIDMQGNVSTVECQLSAHLGTEARL